MADLLQDDFSGGINWLSDPEDLYDNEWADGRNTRLVSKNRVKHREGYTEYNGTATGATEAITAITMFDDVKGTYRPVIQAGGHIHFGNNAFPSTGTFLGDLLVETVGAKPAKFDNMWNTLVMTNEVDVPQIWEGMYGRCGGLKITKDIGVTYIDATAKVVDLTTTTYASLGALDTVANGDWLLIGSRVPTITGFRFEVNANVNTATVTMTVEKLASGSWTSVTVGVDDTQATAGKTLSQSGNVTFTAATTELASYDGMVRYWWRVGFSAALSATVQLTGLYTMYDMQALPNIWSGEFIRPVGVKTTTDTSVTIKDQTQYATDGTLSTKALVGGMTVTTGAIYIQAGNKFNRIRVTMDRTNFNTNAVTMTAQYWNGVAWAALTISDGTSANSKTLAQSGTITFTPPADWQKNKLGVDIDISYQVQLLVGAALSADVDIAEVEIADYPEALGVHKYCLFHKNRLWLANRVDGVNYLFFSAEFLPDVHNGPDAGYIGIPSGEPITAISRFFNELFVTTANEIYIIEGYSPQTFGLLKISTGGVGCVSHKSCVAVGKYIYFLHSTGFYRFDGLGVVLVSKKVSPLFDPNDSTNFLNPARYEYVEGRYNRLYNQVEWTISRGSTQTTNNLVVVFNIDLETWDSPYDIPMASLVSVIDSTNQEFLYHGGYVGKVYRDFNGTTDNGVAISSYFTSRAYFDREAVGYLLAFRGIQLLLEAQSANSLTVQYAAGGVTSFSTFGAGTTSMVRSGTGYTWNTLISPFLGTMAQFKLSFSTSGGSWEFTKIRVLNTAVRPYAVQ